MPKPSFLKLSLVFGAVLISAGGIYALLRSSVSQAGDWRLEITGSGFAATALRLNPLSWRQKRITTTFVFSLSWVITSFFITSMMYFVISRDFWWRDILGLLDPKPSFFISVIAPVLLLTSLVALFRPLAKVMLFSVPIISLLLLAVFYGVSRSPIPCEGLGCSGVALALLLELLVIFVAIAVLPIAWVRWRTQEVNLRALVAHSLMPGLVVIVLFSILWFISTPLIYSLVSPRP